MFRVIFGTLVRCFTVLSYIRSLNLCFKDSFVRSEPGVALSRSNETSYYCQSSSKISACGVIVQTSDAVTGCRLYRHVLHPHDCYTRNDAGLRCGVAAVLYDMATDMGWMTVLVVFDNSSEGLLGREPDGMTITELNVDTADSDTFNTSVTTLYRTAVDRNSHLHAFVLCSSRGIRVLVNKIEEFQQTLHRFSAFDLVSLWLVGVRSDTYDVEFAELEVNLLNVAMVTVTQPIASDKHTTEPFDVDKYYTCSSPIRYNQKEKKSCDLLRKRKIRQSILFPKTTNGLNNMNLTVATIPSTSFVIRTIKNGRKTYSGLCIDILKFLSKALHFRYTIVEPKDGQWGNEIGPGEYSGMIGEIINQKVDFIAAPLVPRQDRLGVMEFTVPYFWDSVVVIFLKPDVDNDKWKTLLNPFRWLVFACIGLSMVFVVLVAAFVESVNPFYPQDRNRTCPRLMYRFFWYIYGSLLRQGGPSLPESLSGRLVIASWTMFCTIIAAVYCTNLIAFLSVSKEVLKYNSLGDLLGDDALEWGAQGNYYFNKLKWGQDKSLWSVIEHKHNTAFLDRDEATHKQKIYNGSYVFVAHYHHVRAWAVRDCTLQLVVPALSVPVLYTFGFPRHSDFTKVFSQRLMDMTDSGLLNEALQRVHNFVEDTKCGQTDTTVARTIDLEDLQTAFYILGVGVVLSVATLVSEVWTSRACGRT